MKMLADIFVFVVIVFSIAPFILGWLFRRKMGMSWMRTISFAICYSLSAFLILAGITMSADGLYDTPLMMPFVISGLISIVVWGIIVVLFLKKKRNFNEKFNFFSYMFFSLPIISGAILFVVTVVAVLLSYTGCIDPELYKWGLSL